MSEYVTIEAEPTETPHMMLVWVNQKLTRESEEHYPTREAGEEGSPLAQSLFVAADQLAALTVYPDHLIITRQPSAAWEALLDDLRDALRDFFL